MEKKILNEELSRIKNMMTKINESEFEMKNSDISMEEQYDDDDDDDDEEEGNGVIKIEQIGISVHNLVIDIHIPVIDQTAKVYIEIDGYDVESIQVDDQTTELEELSIEQQQEILQLVRNAIKSGQIPITPWVVYDERSKHFINYM